MTAASGHGWGLAVFPLIAAAVAAVFAVRLGDRFVRRGRAPDGVWAAALVMYAVAAFAVFLGVARGWNPLEYRLYWLFGAVLNVPFLAQGEIHLLDRRGRMARWSLAAVIVVSVVSAVVVWASAIHPAELSKVLPLGNGAWREDRLPYHLRWLSWIGYLALLGGLVWSARRMRGRPELRDRTTGTLLIALGATVVAIGSGVGAGLGVVPLFSIALAGGIVVMFWGFLRAGRSAAGRPAPPGPAP